jgi:predicted DNA-binding protein (UPF0251 family)
MMTKVSHFFKICIHTPLGVNTSLGGQEMAKYREILRLHSLGINQRSIAAACECSRNTVAKVLGRAEEIGIT